MDAGSDSPLRMQYRGDLDIAIVGMACMFPKSPDLRQYWENIMRRLDCIQEIPEHRWQIPDFFDEDRFARDKVYSKWGGFLESVNFDPMKWKIPPASLLSIDPIQLMSLEVANQAFEDAGYHQRPFPKERTGVIFACAGSHDVGSDYAFRTMLQHYLPRVKDLTPEMRQHITDEINATLPEWTEDSFPGFLMNVIAGRIANRFDLGGPNYVVDAACAASLAALHAAIGQLRLKTVDAMLVGGADGTNNPFCYMSFAKTHALSPRGRSRPFDNSADGIALGEGIAAIMIRRLEDAERDGDKIYAVIKGIGASSDGRNRSMTAPHPPGQILAMQRAYADADIPAATVSLVEAHGTGTAVGDSTEITSLHTLFSEATKDEQYAAVGSVKSMIGHTKTCAGMASLVKASLALKQRVLPPTINVDTPNEKVDFRHSPFFINTEARPWFEELGDHPRRAGVSAFGFGGTNFHVVMEEYARPGKSQFHLDYTPRTAEICVWNRASRAAMVEAIRDLQTRIEGISSSDIAQLALSIRHDESERTVETASRLAIVVSSIDDLRTKLSKVLENLTSKTSIQDPAGIYYSEAAPVAREQVAFLYPGQGSQAVNMLRDLAVVSQWAHDYFTAANRVLREFFPVAVTRLIFPPPVFTPDEETERREKINNTRVAQPALGVVEAFGTDLLARFGVTPGGVAGHSYGEYVALYAAGSLTLDDLLTLSAHRGRVAAAASETCPGAMAAVQAGADQTRTFIEQHGLKVYLANLNAPDQTIIAGAEEDVVQAVAQLNAHDLRTRRIPVSAAFHTPVLGTAAQPLSVVLKATKFQTPKLPVYSNTLASAYPKKPAEIRKLLQRHIVEPVRFEEQMRQMRADGYEVFIEVGPGRVLSGLLGRIFAGNPPTTLSLDASGRDGVTQFAHVLAQLAALGINIDLQPWFEGRGLKAESVPEFAARVVLNSQPKKNDWVLSVHGARPVTPLPQRKGLPGDGLRAKFAGKSGTIGATTNAGVETGLPVMNGHAGNADTKPRTSPALQPVPHPVVAHTTVTEQSRPFATPTVPNGRNRLTESGMPAPAPLPTQARFPATNGAAQPAAAIDRGVTSNHKTNGTAAVPPTSTNGTYAKNGSGTHAPGTNGNMKTHANGHLPRAAVRSQTTAAPAAPLILPGSSVPMAPCLPVVTNWNGHAPMVATTPIAQPTSLNGSHQPTRFAVSNSQSPNSDNGQSVNPAAAQLILQSQALMMQMLDLQKWQQQVALRFVDAHTQLIQGCTGGSFDLGLPAPMMAVGLPTPEVGHLMPTAPQPMTAPAPVAPAPQPVASVPQPVAYAAPQVVAAKPAPVAVVAAPVARPAAPAPARAPVAVKAPAAPAPIPAPVAQTVVATPAAPSAKMHVPAGSSVPTPEDFKRDLLDAVSERTGYPIEMLDLELPMEAGLGIDSIKTVEIFSNLKIYHSFFQQDEQDEEEALKEFTKLKTLGDIISAYELRYQAVTSGGNSPKLADKSGEGVERFTLVAEEAPAMNGQKKTSHVSS